MSNPVRNRLVFVSAAIGAVLLAVTLSSCGSQPNSPTTPSAASSGETDAETQARGGGGGGTAQCADGGIKDEKAPFTASAPAGQLITRVCVKAATGVSELSSGNLTDGCYSVDTIGAATATVTKTGTANNCRDISYVVFYTAAPTPTPTPTDVATPTPTNTPTDTPTGTPTNTPTDTPTPTPTGTPTDTPTPTATTTPTNTPTNTATPTPTNTPTNTPTPTPTNTPVPSMTGGQA